MGNAGGTISGGGGTALNPENRLSSFQPISGSLGEEVKPRSLRFTWSMKTTSSLAPEEMMKVRRGFRRDE